MNRSGRLLTEGVQRRAGVLLCMSVMLSLVVTAWMKGTLGQIGADGDDLMRLVQVRDLLAGQGWFDLAQNRLGLEGGTLMHWSRIVDLPMAMLTLMLAPLTGEAQALVIAYSAWPVLSMMLVVAGLVIGARASGQSMTLLFAMLLGFAILFQHFRFLPGAIDHHNLQLGLLILSVGLLADSARQAVRAGLAGAVLALSVAIGVEVYAFAGAIAAFVAIDWCVSGDPARRGAAAFGGAFAIMLAIIFFATIAPSAYGEVACDAYSVAMPLAGGAGGLGLAFAATFASARNRAVRMACLAGIGLACLSILLVVSPSCLGNPLDALSPDVRQLWLARIDEARPVLAFATENFGIVALRLGTLAAGVVAASVLVIKQDDRRIHMLLGGLTLLALIMTLAQTRFYAFGQLFAILPIAALAAGLFRSGRAGGPRVAYLGILAAGLPFVWFAAASLIGPTAKPVVAASCNTDEMIEVLGALPQGRVLASAGLAPRVLYETHHSALYGNYHRNAAGIETALAILTASTEASRGLIFASGVDYLVVCASDPDMRFFARRSPDGLLATLDAGAAPAWLVRVDVGGASAIYQVKSEP